MKTSFRRAVYNALNRQGNSVRDHAKPLVANWLRYLAFRGLEGEHPWTDLLAYKPALMEVRALVKSASRPFLDAVLASALKAELQCGHLSRTEYADVSRAVLGRVPPTLLDFTYSEDRNELLCPNGKVASQSNVFDADGNAVAAKFSFRTTSCKVCPLQEGCLTDAQRLSKSPRREIRISLSDLGSLPRTVS